MRVRRDRETRFGDGNSSIRILGYIDDDCNTVAMFIVEYLDMDKTMAVNLVVGQWGYDDNIQKGKSAIFSTLILQPEPHFIFRDPDKIQSLAYGTTAETTMSRSDVLASDDLELYKDMLDLIYHQECLPLVRK